MKTKKIVILDYGSGNQKSIFNILDYIGYDVKVSKDFETIDKSSHLILPGVGAYSNLMDRLKKNNLLEILNEQVVIKKKPFLGICVGMQILSDNGLEFGSHQGLKLIHGSVKKMNVKLKLPHIGWNNINIIKDDPIIKNVDGLDFYFLHSFYFHNKFSENLIAETDYEIKFPSIIKKDNIYGFQFHPEKSQEGGKIILKNFVENI